MANRKLVGLVNGVLIVAVLVPIVLSIYLAHRNAEAAFRAELGSFAGRAVIRANRVVDQATKALDDINEFHYTNCSPEHLQAMRRIALKYRYLEEVLFEDKGYIQCSSLGKLSDRESLGKPDSVGSEGYVAWYNSQTDLGFQRQMFYIGRPPHMIAIDPQSFIDVIPSNSNPINIAMIGLNSEKIIASNELLKPEIWHSALVQGKEAFQSQEMAYVIRRDNNLGVAMIAWAPLGPLNTSWYHQLLIWLPIGIAFSLAAGWYIMGLLRKLQSPRTRIANALKNRDFTVMYQPIVNLQNGEGIGAEVLLRWKQPDNTWLSPDIFIPLAEEAGLITQITEQVIDKLFSELGDWLHNHPHHHISINLAPCDIRNVHVLNFIRPYLTRYGIQPQQIAFEVTERGFADPRLSAPVVEQFRRAGHPIYIDDFGTGYSSLSYLQNLAVDVLKIDKSFVDALEYQKVMPHIIEMAKTLDIAMVAEGIETTDQAAWLREHGVQYGQGWLYSKALPKQAFIEWIARNHAIT